MLTDVEVRLLKSLNREWKSWEELEKEIGLNKDGIARTLFFLSQKGLAEIKDEKKRKWILTERGREFLEKGFPEEKIGEWEGHTPKELPSEIREKLGWLKLSGIAVVENGRIRVNEAPYILREALKAIQQGKEIEKRVLLELKKRGLVREMAERTVWGKITEEGEKKVREVGEAIGRLSRELLEKGAWKSKPFRPFNIDLEAVKPLGGGYRHVVKKAIEEIKRVFSEMGFEEMSGDFVESAFWNFDALFQPQDHPSRELADTFYLEGKIKEEDKELVERIERAHRNFWKLDWELDEAEKVVLRTHTTVLSARTLAGGKRGKFFAVGKVFRNEAIDYKHLAEFHQIEGIIAEPGVTFKHLLGILREFYKKLGFEEIRFRPSYFPYTEPSLEIEVWFEPRKEWVELGGAGMFRWEMLRAWGVKGNVLAWGLSLERPLMMLLGLEDIRDLYRNDLDFVRKMGSVSLLRKNKAQQHP